MAWSTRTEAERRDFYVFIDEFQNFTTNAFAAILAEARKYRLCLTLSHQYIDQLPEPIRQAVFGNVGTLIAC
jgi:type IV secretory pathway TraG/TraD family ATPase VirD4